MAPSRLGGAAGVAAAASRARKAPSSAMVVMIGAGNATVVFLSTPISTRLCRLRSCSANGWAIMVSEASPRAAAASDSPSALMILARFSRSASACWALAMDRHRHDAPPHPTQEAADADYPTPPELEQAQPPTQPEQLALLVLLD